jgi:hypothetical protein
VIRVDECLNAQERSWTNLLITALTTSRSSHWSSLDGLEVIVWRPAVLGGFFQELFTEPDDLVVGWQKCGIP